MCYYVLTTRPCVVSLQIGVAVSNGFTRRVTVTTPTGNPAPSKAGTIATFEVLCEDRDGRFHLETVRYTAPNQTVYDLLPGRTIHLVEKVS